jgi:hypothetical protein
MSEHRYPCPAQGMTDLEAAYIAGIVDGEGSFLVYMKRAGRSERKYHRAVLKIANTDRPLIDWIRIRTGGTVSQWQSDIAGRKRMYHLNIEGPGLLELCERIGPLLLVKGEQARMTAQLQRTMSTKRTGMPIPAEVIEKREALRLAIAEAKHGPARMWGGKEIK